MVSYHEAHLAAAQDFARYGHGCPVPTRWRREGVHGPNPGAGAHGKAADGGVAAHHRVLNGDNAALVRLQGPHLKHVVARRVPGVRHIGPHQNHFRRQCHGHRRIWRGREAGVGVADGRGVAEAAPPPVRRHAHREMRSGADLIAKIRAADHVAVRAEGNSRWAGAELLHLPARLRRWQQLLHGKPTGIHGYRVVAVFIGQAVITAWLGHHHCVRQRRLVGLLHAIVVQVIEYLAANQVFGGAGSGHVKPQHIVRPHGAGQSGTALIDGNDRRISPHCQLHLPGAGTLKHGDVVVPADTGVNVAGPIHGQAGVPGR